MSGTVASEDMRAGWITARLEGMARLALLVG